jgi:hypothetical protein
MILSIAPAILGDSIIEFRIASGLTQVGDIDVPGSTDPASWASARAADIAKAPPMDDVGAYRRKLPRAFNRKTALNHDWKDAGTNAVLRIRSDSVMATLSPQNSIILLDGQGVHVLTHLRATWHPVP